MVGVLPTIKWVHIVVYVVEKVINSTTYYSLNVSISKGVLNRFSLDHHVATETNIIIIVKQHVYKTRLRNSLSERLRENLSAFYFTFFVVLC